MGSQGSARVRHEPRRLSLTAHRRFIGFLGLFLPGLTYGIGSLLPAQGLGNDPWKLLDSVSAYYYTGAVGVFVGVLFAVGVYLISYPGYEGFVWDRWVGGTGGIAALLVVMFPTGAPGGVPRPSWWSEWMGVVHYVSATVLFLSFIVFAVWLFRKSEFKRREDRPREKKWRDDICLVCGIVMIGSIAWAYVASRLDRSIFVPEAIAILAFAISWLVKSKAWQVYGELRRLGERAFSSTK